MGESLIKAHCYDCHCCCGFAVAGRVQVTLETMSAVAAVAANVLAASMTVLGELSKDPF